MSYYNSDTLIEQQNEIHKLKEERDALAAQVEALQAHRKELLDLIYNCAIGQVAMRYVVDAETLAQSAYSITGIDAASNKKPDDKIPQHHLRQVRADAVNDFIGFMYKSKDCQLCSESLDKANVYYASILAGKE